MLIRETNKNSLMRRNWETCKTGQARQGKETFCRKKNYLRIIYNLHIYSARTGRECSVNLPCYSGVCHLAHQNVLRKRYILFSFSITPYPRKFVIFWSNPNNALIIKSNAVREQGWPRFLYIKHFAHILTSVSAQCLYNMTNNERGQCWRISRLQM